MEGEIVVKWISVKDRMPPQNECWVLVYADGAMGCMAYHNGKWKDWSNATTPNINVDDITHWMPLPEPPVDTCVCCGGKIPNHD